MTVESIGGLPLFRRFETERAAEALLSTFMREAARASQQSYDNSEDALEVAHELSRELVDRLGECEGSRTMVYLFEGPGVYIPRFEIESSDQKLSVTVNQDQGSGAFRPQDRTESTYGVIREVGLKVQRHDDDTYSPIVSLFCRNSNLKTADIHEDERTLVNIVVTSHFYVMCGEGVSVSVPALTQFQERNASLGALAASCHPDIYINAAKVSEALYREDPHSYTSLRHVERLNAIADRTRENAEQAGVVAESMRNIIGPSRHIVVTGEVYTQPSQPAVNSKISGSLVDVLPYDIQSREEVPTLTLESGGRVWYAPLSGITDLEF